MPTLFQSMCIGAVVVAAGDAVSQLLFIKISGAARPKDQIKLQGEAPWDLDELTRPYRLDNGYDPIRTLRFFIIGGVWMTPVPQAWYNLMDYFLPGRDLWVVLEKMVISRLVFGTFMNGSLMSIDALSRTGSIEYTLLKLRQDLLNVLIVGNIVWPFQNFVNYMYVPVDCQAIGDIVFSFFWSMYLTWACARRLAGDEPAAGAVQGKGETTKTAAPGPRDVVKERPVLVAEVTLKTEGIDDVDGPTKTSA